MSEQIVVVPWDFSRHAHAALQYAVARFGEGSLRVVCVLEPPNPYDPRMNWSEESLSNAREHCARQFEADVTTVKNWDLQFSTRFGEPAAEIISFADEHHADCIVISTHGRTGIKGMFIGSVAQKIAQSADCPIVLLPNKWFEANADTPS